MENIFWIMSQILENLKYTKDHEWVKKLENGHYQMGITDYAQSSLGDIVYVDMPGEGSDLKQGSSIGTIESVKAVSDIYSPMDGSVVSKNETIGEDPVAVNEDPYNTGWLLEFQASGEAQWNGLLSAAQYKELLDAH
ncbi:MAG: glycine cleavage system protein GcvH [Spirochaetia bacterium]|nr:glycine cleavage system protein GcvH [Spirochaetia bacterium]